MPRNPNDLNAYRKRSKLRNNLLRVLAILGAAVAFVLLFIRTASEPLSGIGNRIGTTSDSGDGFPIALSGSAGYSMNTFGIGFTLLSDTYLYTYTEKGGQNFAYRHNYARPSEKTTDRRILLFNQNGHEFSLFNRNSRIYENKLDERIVLAELGDLRNNDMAAVVTTSASLSNILHIYDGSGKWLYTRRFTEEVNAIAFSAKSNELLAATSTAIGGEIVSYVYRLRIDTKDDVIWKQELPRGAWALNLHDNGIYISVLADNMMVSLQSTDGVIAGSYSFTDGALVKPVFGGTFNLVVLSDYVTGKTLYVSLDEKSNLISLQNMNFEAKNVEISGEIVYTLTGGSIEEHDKFLNNTDSVTLDDEFRDFITVNKYVMILGYETIERITIN